MTSLDLDSLLPRLDALRAALARAVVGQPPWSSSC